MDRHQVYADGVAALDAVAFSAQARVGWIGGGLLAEADIVSVADGTDAQRLAQAGGQVGQAVEVVATQAPAAAAAPTERGVDLLLELG